MQIVFTRAHCWALLQDALRSFFVYHPDSLGVVPSIYATAMNFVSASAISALAEGYVAGEGPRSLAWPLDKIR